MKTVWQDIRFGLRMLRKSPGFTLVAVAALGLGVGANTAIFSVVNAVLLRSLPYHDPQRLVMVWEDASKVGFPRNTPALGNYADWKTKIPAFEDVAALDARDFNLTGDGEPEKIGGAGVTSNLFSVLGVKPRLGRVLLP
jgi:putative ABC transport system permease protein